MTHSPYIHLRHRGSVLIEVVVGSVIILFTMVGVAAAYNLYLKTISSNTSTVTARMLLEEGAEAVRVLRDEGWGDFILPLEMEDRRVYYLALESDGHGGWQWHTTTTPVFVDGIFARTVALSAAYRDANQSLAPAGTLDPDVCRVRVEGSWWNGAATTTESAELYIHNL